MNLLTDPNDNEALSALGDEDEDVDIDNIYLRDKLYDAWLWMDVFLPPETDLNG